jgi:hypothetical protein
MNKTSSLCQEKSEPNQDEKYVQKDPAAHPLCSQGAEAEISLQIRIFALCYLVR